MGGLFRLFLLVGFLVKFWWLILLVIRAYLEMKVREAPPL
jgi:hypothetical protein